MEGIIPDAALWGVRETSVTADTAIACDKFKHDFTIWPLIKLITNEPVAATDDSLRYFVE